MFRPNIFISVGGLGGEIGKKCLLRSDKLEGKRWKNNLLYLFFDVDKIEDPDLPSHLKLTRAQKFYLPVTEAEIKTMEADPENYPFIKEKPAHVSVKQIVKGGGGIPYAGYLAFCYYRPVIKRRLEKLFRKFFEKQTNSLQKREVDISVNIVVSSCGSSRGMTIDLAREVKRLILNLGHTPFISLFVISPIGFSDAFDFEKKEKLAYGFVKELCSVVEKEELFDFIYFVDIDLDEGGNLPGLLALEELLADYLVMSFHSSVAQKMDQLNQNVRNTVVSGINKEGARTAFSRLSINKITFPAHQIKRSCEAKLGFEVLDMWLGKEREKEKKEINPSFGLNIDTVKKRIGLFDVEVQIKSRIEPLKKEKPASLIAKINQEKEYQLNPIIATFEIDSEKRKENYEKEVLSRLENIVKLGLSSPSIPLLATTAELEAVGAYCLGQDCFAFKLLEEEKRKLEAEDNVQQIQEDLEKSLRGFRRFLYILGFRKKAKQKAKELICALERFYCNLAGKIANEKTTQFYLDISPKVREISLKAESFVNKVIETKNLLREKHLVLRRVSNSPLELILYEEKEFERYYRVEESEKRNILAQLCQDIEKDLFTFEKTREDFAEHILSIIEKQGIFHHVEEVNLWGLFQKRYTEKPKQKEIIQLIFGDFSSPLCRINKAYPHSEAAKQAKVEKIELFGIPQGCPAKELIEETLGISETNIVSLPNGHEVTLLINEHGLPAYVFKFVERGWEDYREDPAKDIYHSKEGQQDLPDFPWKNGRRHE